MLTSFVKTFICRNRERERERKWYGNITDVASDDTHAFTLFFPPHGSNMNRVQHSSAETLMGSCQPCNQRLIETYSVTKSCGKKKRDNDAHWLNCLNKKNICGLRAGKFEIERETDFFFEIAWTYWNVLLVLFFYKFHKKVDRRHRKSKETRYERLKWSL